MKAPGLALAGVLSIGLLAAPLAVGAQPALEQLRLDPPRLCPRATFRWGFEYRGLPGGLAAVRDLVVEGLWDGPGERTFRSVLTPTRDDLRPYTADQGRFESRLTHAGPPRKAPAGTEIRYTLRVALADGQEVTTATSARYLDACPPPALYATLAAGPTGRIGVQTTTPTMSDFLQGIRPTATSLIWGDLELPPGPVERGPAVVVVHGSGGVGPREDRWAEELRRAGAATFVLDSFTGRGIAFTAEDQSQLSSLAMIGDAYRALELLATHPRIDPARIAVMGFSKGGAVALYAALQRFQRLHGPAGARFAHHVAFYPPCYVTYVGELAVTGSPDPALPRDGRRPRPHRAVSSLRGAAPASRRRRADHRVRRGPPRVRPSRRRAGAPQSSRAEHRPLLLGGAPGRPRREPGHRAAVRPG
jgi:Acetyl xylan esterase (AXE1)